MTVMVSVYPLHRTTCGGDFLRFQHFFRQRVKRFCDSKKIYDFFQKLLDITVTVS